MKTPNKNKLFGGKYAILIFKQGYFLRIHFIKGMKKYAKILVLLLCTAFFTAVSASKTFAADIVNLPTESIKGKFYSVAEGLIIMDQKGVKKSYIRVENQNDIYRDYIIYRKSPFSRNTESSPCKVIFLDTWVVRIKLPNSNAVEIPRYRIKDLEINI